MKRRYRMCTWGKDGIVFGDSDAAFTFTFTLFFGGGEFGEFEFRVVVVKFVFIVGLFQGLTVIGSRKVSAV